MDRFQKIPNEMFMFTKLIRQFCLQIDILDGLLQNLAKNEACATEIIENRFLHDIWDISCNQLTMIAQDMSENTELLRQVMQEKKEK